MLQQFVNILIEEDERMTEKVKNAGGPIEMDLISFVSEHTFNAICETAMGTPLYSLGEIQKRYQRDVHRMCQLYIYRLTKPWLYPKLIFSLTSVGRLQKEILQNLHRFTKKTKKR